MKTNLPPSTFPLGAKPPGANISKAPESLPRPQGEGFGKVIRSALEKRNIRHNEKSVDPSQTTGIGHLTPSPAKRDPEGSTKRPVKGRNAAPPGSLEGNGQEPATGSSVNVPAHSTGDQSDVGVNATPSHSVSATPQSDSLQLKESLLIAPKDPLLEKDSNSFPDQKSDSLPVNLSNPVMRDETVSTRVGLEAGPPLSGGANGNTTLSDPITDTPLPDLLNLKGALLVDSRDSLSRTDFPFPDPKPDLLSADLSNLPAADKRSNPTDLTGSHLIDSKETLPGKGAASSDYGSESFLPDSLNLLPVGKNPESIEMGMEMVKREGIDPLSNEGTKDVFYGSRFQKGSFVGRNATLSETVLSTADSGEGPLLPENVPPLPVGSDPSFSRIGEELLKAGATEKMTIEKGSLPRATENGNSGGLESFPSPQSLGQSLSTSSSHETEKAPLLSDPRTEPTEIYEQVGKQVLWSLKNNEEKIRLVLEPPELGNIYMEVKREKGLVKATLWTDNSATKEILESHQVQLHKLLKADGFSLEKFDVFFQQGTGWFQERREKPVGQGPWTQREPKEEGISPGPISREVDPIQASLFSPGSQYVDVFI